jgi:hypothetical protein
LLCLALRFSVERTNRIYIPSDNAGKNIRSERTSSPDSSRYQRGDP